ncbi:MAG: type II CRISPR RNA-guided endonuclease Cas9 [Prolixibacteraceae bacterium]|jgi:CRISPR-associated endonuclease Csn1|nr:type II CRISPR RNA-guided endonuclease Cas9 [Prolixibacteraceae bacterium]
MKKILGLDLGTNSIGWALVEQDFDKKEGDILGLGSRIIPMSQDVLGKFDSGVSISQTADRTNARGVRRLYQRDNLRRERLHRVLNILGFLPEHYASSIDFTEKLGQFKDDLEIKLNYRPVLNEINGKTEFEFIFKESFNEMVNDFVANSHTTKIPYDWTLYYLRKKALTNKITKEELAWIILNFNQKRGYYQLRGEEEEDDNTKNKEYFALKVLSIEATDDKNAKGIWYNVNLENGWIYKRQSKESLDAWLGKIKEFIVTTQFEKDGSEKLDKEGNVRRSFSAVDSKKDWIAIKKRTEQNIDISEETVGTYIYNTLLENPTQKIRGKLVRTIERKYYKEELQTILQTQCKLHSELQNRELYKACIDELYPRNEAHQANISEKDFVHLFLNDIIFYQRPLKSKKSTIANCPYESRTFKKKIEVKENDQLLEREISVNEGIKAIAKSNPLFQEFRLWQFLKNLKIYQIDAKIGDKSIVDHDVTGLLLEDEKDWVELFDFLNKRKEIEQHQLVDYFCKKGKIAKNEKKNYRWNYVEDKKYPCNDTKAQFLSRLGKVRGLKVDEFFTTEIEHHLWHLIYSVKDKNEYKSALKKFASNYEIDKESFVESFIKFPPFANDYGAYSEKAIKKLLPLMRRGVYWNENDISAQIKERANSIFERLDSIHFNVKRIDEKVIDDDIPKQILKSFIAFESNRTLSGLNTYQACYLVYNRHSESNDQKKWETPQDIYNYLSEFKQHSLRNPIVEQVVTETLRVVKDIWAYYGDGANDFFKEIHVELGREMKNPAKKREMLSKKIAENENTNVRIRELLQELKNDNSVEGDVRPYSPSHQEILKIYEEGVYQSNDKVDEDIDKIRKNPSLTKSEINRYKLWLEQGYLSPYTGAPIPLSKLFTTDYQIEHIIPQSRLFDDSLSNKIICESEVNQLKDNQTAFEFLKNEKGRIVELTHGRTVRLFEIESYQEHCNNYFKKNRTKLKKLLSEDIPEGFIDRQLNDSRYISKLIKGLLSNIVKEENEQEATSKNIVTINGAITSQLKRDWGLNDKWNEIVVPRFKRMNEITQSNDFGFWDDKINAFRTQVPDALSRGFNKKRIDHRHHALDALIIACVTKDHINYITSLNTERKNYGLVNKLRHVEEKQIKIKATGELKTIKVPTNYILPWSNFPVQAYVALGKIIISFKQNLRVINKTNNKTQQWVEQRDGSLKKQLVKQTKGDNWAIRKSMHKDTVSSAVNIRTKKTVSFQNGLKDWKNLVDKTLKTKIKAIYVLDGTDKTVVKYFKDNPYLIDESVVKEVEVYTYTKDATATRTSLTDKFTRKQFENITDSGIKKILGNHIANYIDETGKERIDLALNPDGLDELNKNIVALNDGKPHQPIYKVRVYEEGSKFRVGDSGNKNKKFVEAAKGTNLFFVIYWNDEKQKREYDTIPLNEVIAHQKIVAHLPKEERTLVPVNSEKGTFLFTLSPNDLVYVPSDEEIDNLGLVDFKNLNKEQVERVYKMVSSTGVSCFFVQASVANPIMNKVEFSALNKSERSIDNAMIKDRCWKLEVDRLGNIVKLIRR